VLGLVGLAFGRIVFEERHNCILRRGTCKIDCVFTGIGWPQRAFGWEPASKSQGYVPRIDQLRETSAHVKFLSLEPLLGRLRNLDLRGIDWVIVGGESGPGGRPMNPDWAREIRDQCQNQKIPFFFKQWGGVFKKRTGRVLDGRTWEEFPRCVGLSEHD
jgi:protein gp37